MGSELHEPVVQVGSLDQRYRTGRQGQGYRILPPQLGLLQQRPTQPVFLAIALPRPPSAAPTDYLEIPLPLGHHSCFLTLSWCTQHATGFPGVLFKFRALGEPVALPTGVLFRWQWLWYLSIRGVPLPGQLIWPLTLWVPLSSNEKCW